MCLHDAFPMPYLMCFRDIPGLVSHAFSAIPIFLSFNSQNFFIYLSLLFFYLLSSISQEDYPACCFISAALLRQKQCLFSPRRTCTYMHVGARSAQAQNTQQLHKCICALRGKKTASRPKPSIEGSTFLCGSHTDSIKTHCV